MSEDLESRLRAALRPVMPRDAFSKRLVAQVTADQASISRGAGGRTRLRPAAWLAAGIAASVLLAVGVQHHLQEQQDRERGLEARREVIQALRVTSQKLHLAYEAVEHQS